jgi:hypothetical protein
LPPRSGCCRNHTPAPSQAAAPPHVRPTPIETPGRQQTGGVVARVLFGPVFRDHAWKQIAGAAAARRPGRVAVRSRGARGSRDRGPHNQRGEHGKDPAAHTGHSPGAAGPAGARSAAKQARPKPLRRPGPRTVRDLFGLFVGTRRTVDDDLGELVVLHVVDAIRAPAPGVGAAERAALGTPERLGCQALGGPCGAPPVGHAPSISRRLPSPRVSRSVVRPSRDRRDVHAFEIVTADGRRLGRMERRTATLVGMRCRRQASCFEGRARCRLEAALVAMEHLLSRVAVA